MVLCECSTSCRAASSSCCEGCVRRLAIRGDKPLVLFGGAELVLTFAIMPTLLLFRASCYWCMEQSSMARQSLNAVGAAELLVRDGTERRLSDGLIRSVILPGAVFSVPEGRRTRSSGPGKRYSRSVVEVLVSQRAESVCVTEVALVELSPPRCRCSRLRRRGTGQVMRGCTTRGTENCFNSESEWSRLFLLTTRDGTRAPHCTDKTRSI